MNKTELIEFFHYYYECPKGRLKTFKGIGEVADQLHYDFVKNGVDDYTLYERGIILDFTKPLKFIRDIPTVSAFDSYKGLYRQAIEFDPLWFYLINQEDGKKLSINFLAESLQKSVAEIIRTLDSFVASGYLYETAENLEFYFYPLKRTCEEVALGNYYAGGVPRQAPAIYN